MKNSASHAIGVGPTRALNLRVSVAVLARVLFKHPSSGIWMLALERRATLVRQGEEEHVVVKAQPFGGAVYISDLQEFQKNVGEFHFDSRRSHDETDFRIFIKPSSWPGLRAFCIKHLKNEYDPVLENDPVRELVEEFEDSLQVRITHDQFISKPVGIVLEETPVSTDNARASGHPTVRVYQIFETLLADPTLAKAVVSGSNQISDEELSELVLKDALAGGKGRANGVLAMPLIKIFDFYTSLRLEDRNKAVVIDGQIFAETIPIILEGIEVPKYKRI